MDSLKWLDTVKGFYSKQTPKPSISPSFAALTSAAYTLLYVIPFYLSSTTRPSPSLSRDSPVVIKARIRAITLSCLASGLLTSYLFLNNVPDASPTLLLHALGFWPLNLGGTVRTIVLVLVLFAGPLFEAAFADRRLSSWLNGSACRKTFSSWIGWRNFVAGPLSEEILFRSFMVPLHLMANIPPSKIIFLTPLYFGIAHVHHFYEFRLVNPTVPMLPALVRSLFQFTYTSVFGWFATFVYLRTGSVCAPLAAHILCNWMGLPRLSGRIQVEPGEPLLPPPETKDDDEIKARIGSCTPHSPHTPNSPYVPFVESHIGWSIAYYTLLLLGAFAFNQLLWPLTECGRDALATF